MKNDKTIKTKNKNDNLSVSKTDDGRFVVSASETFQGWDGPHPCSETNQIKFFFDSKEFVEFLNDLQETYVGSPPIVMKQTIHEVWTNSDLEEGRGRSVCIGKYLHHEMAMVEAQGKGVFGCNAEILTKTIDTITMPNGEVFYVGDKVVTQEKPEPPFTDEQAKKIEQDYQRLMKQRNRG